MIHLKERNIDELQLGSTAPDFEAETTEGRMGFVPQPPSKEAR
jgi:hypothetical protein